MAMAEVQRRGGGRPLPPSARGPPRPPLASKSGPRFEPVDREKVFPFFFICFLLYLRILSAGLLRNLQYLFYLVGYMCGVCIWVSCFRL